MSDLDDANPATERQLDPQAVRRRLGASDWQLRPHPLSHALHPDVQGFVLAHRRDGTNITVIVCDAAGQAGVRIITAALSRPGYTKLTDRTILKRVFPGAVAQILAPTWRGRTLQLWGRLDGQTWTDDLEPVPIYDPDKLTAAVRQLMDRLDRQDGQL